jgi:hypothetical protein
MFFASHLQKIASENLSNVMEDYLPNASIDWTNQAGDLRGLYANVTGFYELVFPQFYKITITNESYQGEAVGDAVSINASFYFYGQANATTSGCGHDTTFNGTILAQTTLVPLADSWAVQNEKWDFTIPFTWYLCGGF